MNTSARDRVLLLVLPSALVLMVYVLFFARPAWERGAKLDKELADARAKAPPPAQFRTVNAQMADLDREMVELRKLQKDLEDRWRVQAASCLDPAGRHERLARMVALLGRHRLALLEQAPAGAGAKVQAPRPSPALEKLALRLQATAPGKQAPQTWSLHLVGTFPDMMRALRELGSGDPLAIPVGLSMDEVLHTTSLREWRLWLWI